MSSLIDTVNWYKTLSADPIVNQQKAYIPRLETNQVEYIATHYIIDGKRIPVNITKQLLIKLRFLNFRSFRYRNFQNPEDPEKPWDMKSTPTKKFLDYDYGVFSMQELIDKKVIEPFMLFVNGWFIPWKFLTIVIADEMYYILIDATEEDGTVNEHFSRVCKSCDFVQIVTLPENCICVTEYDNPIGASFSFDENGKFDIDNPVYFIISTESSYRFNYWHSNQAVNAFRVLNQQDIKLTEANIMLFVNGLFGTGIREKVPRAIDGDTEHFDEFGNFCVHPCIDFTYTPNYVTPNPIVTMHSSLLSINRGNNENGDVYDFGLFVNPNYEVTIDNLSRIDLDELAPIVREYNLTGEAPDYLEGLFEPFEMKMDRRKFYAENLADALRTISKYNSDLFTSIFEHTSNLEIEEHDYEWIQAHTKGGAITLPISHGYMVDEFIIVLVNGRMYEYQHMIKYFANRVIIPIQHIGPDDTFELLRFKNINNFEKKVIINEDDGYINYSSEIINDKLCFFSKEYNGAVYEFDTEGGRQHFEIPYKLEKNEKGLTKIIFDDPFYYGKELIMTYKDRFKWEVYTVVDTGGYSDYCIDLGDRFKYCNEYHRFLIFLNNNRLTSDHYRLTLPVRPTTPFKEFKLYLTIPIHEGDRLDILYTPALFQDIIVRDTIDTSGDIVIDKRVLDYGLTTDLYMVWINGKKVAQSNISDIDSTHIRVTSNEKSTSTLCITKFIPSISAIDEAFDQNTALWDVITSYMTTEEINKLLGIPENTITNEDEDRYPDSATIKQIMNELIRDEFINNPSIDLSGPFVYDYLDVDTSIVSGYDKDNTAQLETADANHEENLAILNREYP